MRWMWLRTKAMSCCPQGREGRLFRPKQLWGSEVLLPHTVKPGVAASLAVRFDV